MQVSPDKACACSGDLRKRELPCSHSFGQRMPKYGPDTADTSAIGLHCSAFSL